MCHNRLSFYTCTLTSDITFVTWYFTFLLPCQAKATHPSTKTLKSSSPPFLYLYSHKTSRQCWFSLHLKSNLPHSLKKVSMNSNLKDIMFALSKIALFASFALMVPTSLVGAVPYPHGGDHEASTVSGPAITPFPVPVNSTGPSTPAESSSTYWLSSIKRQGTVPFGEASFKVFRNVREYGAAGMSFSERPSSFPVFLH